MLKKVSFYYIDNNQTKLFSSYLAVVDSGGAGGFPLVHPGGGDGGDLVHRCVLEQSGEESISSLHLRLRLKLPLLLYLRLPSRQCPYPGSHPPVHILCYLAPIAAGCVVVGEPSTSRVACWRLVKFASPCHIHSCSKFRSLDPKSCRISICEAMRSPHVQDLFKSSICTRTCCSRSRALGQDLPGVKRSIAEVAGRVESLRDSAGEVSSTWYQDSWLRLHSQVFGESQGVVNTTILVIVKPFSQYRGHMLKLSIRDTAGCKHRSSEHSGVLRQLGEGAGLQGPGHLCTPCSTRWCSCSPNTSWCSCSPSTCCGWCCWSPCCCWWTACSVLALCL